MFEHCIIKIIILSSFLTARRIWVCGNFDSSSKLFTLIGFVRGFHMEDKVRVHCASNASCLWCDRLHKAEDDAKKHNK